MFIHLLIYIYSSPVCDCKNNSIKKAADVLLIPSPAEQLSQKREIIFPEAAAVQFIFIAEID